jgi:hypothetical protein
VFKLLAESSFKKPTIQEIKEYADSIGFNSLDSDSFFWYNEARGWKDKNGQPYQNWKGIVQVWFRARLQTDDPKQGKSFRQRFQENQT